MEPLPDYIPVIFVLTTFLTVFFFYKAARNSALFVIIVALWLAVQSLLSLHGFYTPTSTIPPRFILLVLPPLLMITALFLSTRGRRYIDGLNPGVLTLLHSSRILVELVLFWLFLHKAVPRTMTFEGGNLDMLSGLTAPVVYYFGFVKHRMGKRIPLLWNFICLGLLINVVVNAIFSIPFPFQKFAFSQPNIAVLYFPFVWLPSCIVPLVLFSHLATIRQLLKQ